MTRPTQKMIALFDAYTHGIVDRRRFLERLTRLTGGAAAASAAISVLANDYARAAITSQNYTRLPIGSAHCETCGVIDLIEPEETSVGGPNAGVYPTRHVPFLTAYHAEPKDKKSAPPVLVIHENRGLNAHIKDVARRLALGGFDVYAIDMLSAYGGTPSDEAAARAMIGKLDREKSVLKLAAVSRELAGAGAKLRKVGAVGFCWGGGMVNRLAGAPSSALDAGVAYYGATLPAEEAVKIKARMLLHYAGLDNRINKGVRAFEAALKSAGVGYDAYTYPGVNHAFNNDTNAARYNKEAADLAWGRTVRFLKETLS